ncbi:hypothetical protein VLF92_13490, partial [Pseudomonas chengduensis]
IFALYGFKDPQEVFLLPSRYLSEKDHLLLEAVFEYRKVIKEDPYPESYIEQKSVLTFLKNVLMNLKHF